MRKAEGGRASLRNVRKLAKSEAGLHAITFDLQQAMPIPKLSTGPAFYLRKIWGYNFGIHCLNDEQGFCFFWDESVAGRGSEEIISCLNEYFTGNDIHAERLVVTSDNCSGQNKNWAMIAYWMNLISTGRFDTIEHHFPLPGHTMLPSDEDFGIIESFTRKHVSSIFTPEEWISVITKCCRKRPMKVCHMKQDKFMTFNNLKAGLNQRMVTQEGHKISFLDITKLRFSKNKKNTLEVCTHYNNDIWEEVSVAPRGRQKQFSKISLKVKHAGPRSIDLLKAKDVRSLYQYIPQKCIEEYYNKILPEPCPPHKGKRSTEDSVPFLDETGTGEDFEENVDEL